MRLYDDFFNSISEGTIALKSEEPIFAQQLYRELTAVVQRMITHESADVVKALRKAEESFQEYLDDECWSSPPLIALSWRTPMPE